MPALSENGAFAVLRRAGFRYGERDMIKVFDQHRDLPAADFIKAAKSQAPNLFYDDVRDLSPADYQARLKEIGRPSFTKRAVPAGTPDAMTMGAEEYDAACVALGVRPAKKAPKAPSDTGGFNALTASPEEYEARLKSLNQKDH